MIILKLVEKLEKKGPALARDVNRPGNSKGNSRVRVTVKVHVGEGEQGDRPGTEGNSLVYTEVSNRSMGRGWGD